MHESFDFKAIIGLERDDARLAEVTAAFASIAAEIARLRTLDLGETHPAVVFHPLAKNGTHDAG